MDDNTKVIPWQFSTAGLIVGFLFGLFPFFIALVGNHQFKQNKDTEDLKSAYNIILILSIVLTVLIVIFCIFIMAATAMPMYSEFPNDYLIQ